MTTTIAEVTERAIEAIEAIKAAERELIAKAVREMPIWEDGRVGLDAVLDVIEQVR